MILLDECVPRTVGERLQAAGFPVSWMARLQAGAPDTEVLRRAKEGGMILLTRDKDFGDLVFRDGLPACGVVLYRLPSMSVTQIGEKIIKLVAVHRPPLRSERAAREQAAC